MQKVKIALSGHTILFFPFYLLAKDPLSYGLNGFEIILENKNGDLQALDAIGKDCQFGVCDPALLYKYTLDETITRTAIKPIIIKTALWGVTNHFKFKEFGRNEMFLAKMESSNTINTQFKNIHTYHDGTTAYKSMEYLKKPISKFKNFTTKDTETVAHSIIGKEFLPFYQKNNNQDLVITSDILKIIILEKDKHKFKHIKIAFEVFNLETEVFQKSIFSALITKTQTLKNNRELITTISKALDMVLEDFYNSTNAELEEMAKNIFDYSKKNKVFTYTESLGYLDIIKALKVLKNHNLYPKTSILKKLDIYWHHTCVLWYNQEKVSNRFRQKKKDKYNLVWSPQGGKTVQSLIDSLKSHWILWVIGISATFFGIFSRIPLLSKILE